MPRCHALALALLLASPALGQDLITNGDFTSGVSALDGARSVGAFSSVRRSDDTMLAFPGTKTTALQLLPGAEVAINAALSTHLREGWYQIKFFLYVSADYTYSGGGAWGSISDKSTNFTSTWPFGSGRRERSKVNRLIWNPWVCGSSGLSPLM